MYSVRNLVTEIKADFEARGVTAEVVFGTWNVAQHAGANRVVIGLGPFKLSYKGAEFIDKNPSGFGGVRILPGNTQAASAIMMHIQNLKVYCHGIADEGTALEDIPAINHDRTQELMHATVAALWRVCGGPGAFGIESGEWLQEESGDVVFGACAVFDCAIAVPVLGDKWGVAQILSTTTKLNLALPSGTVLAGQVTVPPTP